MNQKELIHELVDKTSAQMRKGILELCILSIISEKEIYSSDILKKLETSKLLVKEGTLYPLLSRLKGKNLLQYDWKESTGGPPRKYYSITSDGQEFLKALHENWRHLVEAVNQNIQNTIHNEKNS